MIDNICAERYVEKSKYRVNGKVLTGGLFLYRFGSGGGGA